ncbi:MAG: hypothetical protein MH204_00270 [Fimbriimonadaceae bacterium]|nr:hypothetical protein [Fimbriimonadaceae bacterium]
MGKPNVCFFSIWERTESWIAIGRELADQHQVGVFHVVTPEEYLKMCLENGVPRENILWLRIDEALAAPLDTQALAQIAEYEAKTGLSLKNFLMMDRFLRIRPWEEMQKYAAYCFRKIHDFLDKHDVQLCSGEPSDTHDLVALLICRATGRHYGAPFDVRFPVSRFALWDSECEVNPLPTGAESPDTVTEEELALARAAKEKILKRERMQHLQLVQKPPKMGARYWKRITRGVLYRSLVRAKHDGHMYSLKGALFDLKYHMIPIRYRLCMLQWKKLFEQPVPGEKFVLFTLNYQPEHSVDVEGSHFMNSYEVCKSIARTLPIDVKLYVKEHKSALGVRGPSYLKQIKRLPGVRLIDPYVDSHDLIKTTEMVTCITGTIAIEAAMYGKRAAMLGNTYIPNLSTVQKMKHPCEVGELLRSPAPKHDPEADLRYMAWLLSNSHEGTIVDRITNPVGTSPENIALVTKGYMRVINGIESGRIQARPLVDGTAPWLAS